MEVLYSVQGRSQNLRIGYFMEVWRYNTCAIGRMEIWFVNWEGHQRSIMPSPPTGFIHKVVVRIELYNSLFITELMYFSLFTVFQPWTGVDGLALASKHSPDLPMRL